MISKIRSVYLKLTCSYNHKFLLGGLNQLRYQIGCAFSTVIPKLSNTEQQALVAYFAFIYIVNFKPENYLKDPRSMQ